MKQLVLQKRCRWHVSHVSQKSMAWPQPQHVRKLPGGSSPVPASAASAFSHDLDLLGRKSRARLIADALSIERTR